MGKQLKKEHQLNLNHKLNILRDSSLGIVLLQYPNFGVVVITTAQFILQNLNSDSMEIQVLLTACQRFTVVRSLTMVLAGNKA